MTIHKPGKQSKLVVWRDILDMISSIEKLGRLVFTDFQNQTPKERLDWKIRARTAMKGKK